ncbi:hypothetical protein D3C80_1460590 [compost metagenome]
MRHGVDQANQVVVPLRASELGGSLQQHADEALPAVLEHLEAVIEQQCMHVRHRHSARLQFVASWFPVERECSVDIRQLDPISLIWFLPYMPLAAQLVNLLRPVELHHDVKGKVLRDFQRLRL